VLPRVHPSSTPDHLAVIRPPTAACLTARAPASVRSTAAAALARLAVGLRRFFGSPECPVDRDPLRPLFGRLVLVPASGPASSCLIPARRGHVNAGGILEIEVPSIVRARCRRSCESLFAAPWVGWPAGAGAVRFHRCTRHRLDLALDPLSRDDSRPRTL
jgi:hypothetical protein